MKLHMLLPVLGAVAALTLAVVMAKPEASTQAADAAVEALDVHLGSLLVPSAMAQAHRLLIDRHSQAGLACTGCHGEAAFSEPVDEATCTTCHGTYAELALKTAYEPNPHQSHMGELACSTCHNIHKPSVSFCDECHSFGMQVP